MKKMLNLFIVIVFIGVFSLAFTAEATAAEKVLKVGNLGPLTGPAASWGLAVQRGIDIAVEDLNRAGGIKVGNERYLIEIVHYDTKAAPTDGKSSAERLIFLDKVKFILGPIVSPVTLAVQTITEPTKILILHMSVSPDATGPHKPYSFMLMNTNKQRMAVLAKWLRDKYPDAKRYAIFNPDQEAGRSDTADQKRFLDMYRFELVASEVYSPGTRDFYPILTRILATKPEMISLGVTSPGDQGLVLKQLGELGFSGVKMINTVPQPTLIYKSAGEASKGTIILEEDYSSGGKFITPEKQRLYDVFVKKYGTENWNPFARTAYSYVQALSKSIEGAGSLNVEDVIKYLSTHQIPCIFGNLHFGPPGNRQGYVPIPIGRMEKDKLITVDIIPIPEPVPGM